MKQPSRATGATRLRQIMGILNNQLFQNGSAAARWDDCTAVSIPT